MKKLVSLLLVFVCALSLAGCTSSSPTKTIVTTNFPAYDFVRAIVGKNSGYKVKVLIKPGTDVHSYEPTPKDIIAVENADLFFYVGGDSDEWVEGILHDIDKKKTKVVKMLDLVSSKREEESVEGMQEEHEGHEEEETEYDEHVWTSPANVVDILQNLEKKIIAIDPSHQAAYMKNAQAYIKQVKALDTAFQDVVKHAKRKELIFGDRFPFLYFMKEYGLSYRAAFAGCAEQTEASAATLSYLIDYVKAHHLHYVLKLELSNGKVAQTIAGETGAKVLTFNSVHNVTSTQFKDGVTYVDLMQKNISVLRKVLNASTTRD